MPLRRAGTVTQAASGLWRKRHKRPAVAFPRWDSVMTAEFSVRPDKWGFLAPRRLVRCGSNRVRRSLAHVKDTRESTPETRAPANPVRCWNSGARLFWRHEKAACESAHETQAPPKPSAMAEGRAGAFCDGQGGWGDNEIGGENYKAGMEGRRPHRGGTRSSLAAWLHWLRQELAAWAASRHSKVAAPRVRYLGRGFQIWTARPSRQSSSASGGP
jgi:hypothetical protein